MKQKEKMPRPKMNGAVMKRLLKYVIGKHKFAFGVVLFCILLSALSSVGGSLFIKIIIDDYITPMISAGSRDFTGLAIAVLLMGGLFLLGVLATFVYTRIMVTISQESLKVIRDDMFEHMQKLPVKYFDTHTYGETMSRYTNDTDTLRDMIGQSIPQVVSALVTIISVFVAMLWVSWILTILVVAMLILMMLVSKFIGARASKHFIDQQLEIAKVDGYIEEMITGQRVVKVFCHENRAEKDFDVLNEKLAKSATDANTYANVLMPAMGNLGNLQYVLIAIVGGFLAIGGIAGVSIGDIGAFLNLSRSFTNPFSQMAQQINTIAMALAGAERIFELLDEEPEQDEGYVTLVNVRYGENGETLESETRTGEWAWRHPHGDGSVTYTPLLGDVQFHDADFGYTDEKIVLHDITLHAHPGEKVAFVGATGAGKTTITNLINRFYDIQDGKIRYDGINVNKIKKADLRRSLGVVLQDTNLFSGTIRENIRYGKLDATDEEVYAAAKLANADGFISMLPKGYDTELSGDGSELSQGQRQLLSIARAAVADPPVLILDEATSSIDTRTEAIVQRGMDSLMRGRTVFVIAHRLSTVRNSDAIMVLEAGRIIERGSHDGLIAQRGKYYQLYTGAFELE